MTLMLVLLSALAGAIHVLAPDHWVPASILSWQRRWRAQGTAFFMAAALTLHVLLGAALYFALDKAVLRALDPSFLFSFTVIFLVLVMGVRLMRFSRIQNVQRLGPHLGWGMAAVFSLLGPCEAIVPIFMKSSALGVGYLLPAAAFLLGSVGVGTLLVLSGKLVWDRPLWLTRAFDWVNQRVAVLPVAAGVALGLRYLFRLG